MFVVGLQGDVTTVVMNLVVITFVCDLFRVRHTYMSCDSSLSEVV